MNIGNDLREITMKLEETTRGLSKEHSEELWNLAARVDRLEGNFNYIGMCLVADAEQEAGRKQAASYILSRKHAVLDALSRALAGFPVWQFPVTRQRVQADAESVKEQIADRLGKIRHDKAK